MTLIIASFSLLQMPDFRSICQTTARGRIIGCTYEDYFSISDQCYFNVAYYDESVSAYTLSRNYNLIATQKYINVNKVSGIVATPSANRIKIAHQNENLIIVDGHHRFIANLFNNQLSFPIILQRTIGSRIEHYWNQVYYSNTFQQF